MNKFDIIRDGHFWIYKEKIFFTDPLTSGRVDAVFPLCTENEFFIENLNIKEGTTVLDLCTGCGINAIFAADTAEYVYAIDINPRAIKFGKLNSQLNGLDKKIKFYIGSLFEPFNNMKFDYVLANPPFEPVLDGYQYFIHSNGGLNGLDIVFYIIKNAHNFLTKIGKIQLISYIYNRDQKRLIEKILKKQFANSSVNVIKEIRKEDFINYYDSKLALLGVTLDLNILREKISDVMFIIVNADHILCNEEK